MTPEHEQDLYALRRQAAELDLRAAELRLLTAEAEYRAATENRHILQPNLGSIMTGYETKDHP